MSLFFTQEDFIDPNEDKYNQALDLRLRTWVADCANNKINIINEMSLLNQKSFGQDFTMIELYVLVDKDGRICYTGEYNDLKSKQTNEYKLLRLEGVL